MKQTPIAKLTINNVPLSECELKRLVAWLKNQAEFLSAQNHNCSKRYQARLWDNPPKFPTHEPPKVSGDIRRLM